MDERVLQRSSPIMWHQLAQGNIGEAARITFRQSGRPMTGLIGMVPAAFDLALHTDLVAYSVWNALVTLAIAVLVFKMLRLFAPTRWHAVGGLALFALLHENSLWVRHLLSYDWALLILLAVLYQVLARPGGRRFSRSELIALGMTSALGFSTYPGYFTLVYLTGGVILLTSTPRWANSIMFVGGNALVMFLFEVLSRLVGARNTESVVGLAGTINHGDFADGYVFAIRYLWAADGIYGMLLLACFLVGVCAALAAVSAHTYDPRIRATVTLAFLAYIAYGTLGVVFHSVVEYGRLVHQYTPFVVIGAVLGVLSLPGRWSRLAPPIWCALLCIGMFSFVRNAINYVPMRYMRDVATMIPRDQPEESICFIYGNDAGKRAITPICRYVAVNLRYLRDDKERGRMPVDAWAAEKPFLAPREWRLLLSAPHPLTYPPYRFSGFNREQRKNLEEFPPLMALYRTSE